LRKFIVVVPSVAVREGVIKTLKITQEHLRALYDNVPYRHTVYDSKSIAKVRQFAQSDCVELLVMTIDSFNKETTSSARAQIGCRARRRCSWSNRRGRSLSSMSRKTWKARQDQGIGVAGPVICVALFGYTPQSVQPGLPADALRSLQAVIGEKNTGRLHPQGG